MSRPVPFAHLRCPRHRRMKPKPGVILTVPKTSWRNCRDCHTAWREGMGPGSEPPEGSGWTGRTPPV